MKSILILLLVLTAAMIAFCNFYYQIKVIHLVICTVVSLLFAMIAVRVSAESGLSAGLALNIFMIVISYGLTGNAVFSMLIAFMNFNTFILAQDTMYDLKIGQMVSASPKKQIKAQFIGIFSDAWQVRLCSMQSSKSSASTTSCSHSLAETCIMQ